QEQERSLRDVRGEGGAVVAGLVEDDFFGKAGHGRWGGRRGGEVHPGDVQVLVAGALPGEEQLAVVRGERRPVAGRFIESELVAPGRAPGGGGEEVQVAVSLPRPGEEEPRAGRGEGWTAVAPLRKRLLAAQAADGLGGAADAAYDGNVELAIPFPR